MFFLFLIRDQSWPCRKIGQGHPRVIIWTNLAVLEHPMLHTKLQSHRPFGSGEEDFLRFLAYMDMAAILVMWPRPFEQTFVSPPQGGSLWNLASIGPVVSEENMFENVDIHTYIHTYGRRRPAYPISSSVSLRLRWANNTNKKFASPLAYWWVRMMEVSPLFQFRSVEVSCREVSYQEDLSHWRFRPTLCLYR